MLAFCLMIMFSSPHTKTHKLIPVKLNENSDWIPQQKFSESSEIMWLHDKKLEKSKVKTAEKQDHFNKNSLNTETNIIFNIENLNKNYRKFTDIINKKKMSQSGNIQYITPRHLRDRSQIDGRADNILYNNNALSKIKTSILKNSNTSSSEIEIYHNHQLLDQLIEKNFTDKKIREERNKTEMSENKDSVKDNCDSTNVSITTQIALNFEQAINSTQEKNKLLENRLRTNHKAMTQSGVLDNINKNSFFHKTEKENNTSTKSEEKIPKSSITSYFNQYESPSTITGATTSNKSHQKIQQEASKLKIDEKDELKPMIASYYSRIRKEDSLLPTQKKMSSSNDQTTESRFKKQADNSLKQLETKTDSDLQGQSTQFAARSGYSTYLSAFKAPTLFDYSQKAVGYSREPIKSSYQAGYDPLSYNIYPYKSHDINFQIPAQELDESQQQENQQLYSPPIQSYQTTSQIVKNSSYNSPIHSYYNTIPSRNYQSYGVSYQNEPSVEFITENYPLIGKPSQTFQVPTQITQATPFYQVPPVSPQSYPNSQYGLPQLYGPPQLAGLQTVDSQKPYRLRNYSKIILTAEQCVMSKKIMSEAVIEIAFKFNPLENYETNCAVMLTSMSKIAVSSMIQSEQTDMTATLVQQLQLRLFSVLKTGQISEIRTPWFVDDKSPGLILGDSNTIIITLQPTKSTTFKLLIFSYKEPVFDNAFIFNFALPPNSSTPISLNETETEIENV